MHCAVVHPIALSDNSLSLDLVLVITVTHSVTLTLFVDCLVLSLPPSPFVFFCPLRVPYLSPFVLLIIISIVCLCCDCSLLVCRASILE